MRVLNSRKTPLQPSRAGLGRGGAHTLGVFTQQWWGGCRSLKRTYTFFFSIMVYCRILNIVPCAIQ